MDRLQTAAGVPTKVPYLFATMMRRLMQNKDLRPDYLAVVFDVTAPTFRDKIFAAVQGAAAADAGRAVGADSRSCGDIARRCDCRFSNIPATKRTT